MADASKQALTAAKQLVAYIEFFRTHSGGECMKRFPDDDPMGGYENIVRRSMECAAEIESFARGWGAHDRPAQMRKAAPDLYALLHEMVEAAGNAPPELLKRAADLLAGIEGGGP